MKRYTFLTFLTITLFSASPAFTQDFAVVTSIGKPQKHIINTFGKPVYVDNSIPSMVCMFYKSPNMVFVSDQSGIFQADIQKEFPTENQLRTQLTKCIEKSITSGFTADTLSVNEIVLSKSGIRAEIHIQKIPDSGKYILKIEAKRRE